MTDSAVGDRYSLRPNNPVETHSPRRPKKEDKYIEGYDFYYAARRLTSNPTSESTVVQFP